MMPRPSTCTSAVTAVHVPRGRWSTADDTGTAAIRAPLAAPKGGCRGGRGAKPQGAAGAADLCW